MGFTLSHRSLVPALFALAILSMPAPALAATDNQLLDRSACAALIAGQAADAISSFEGDVEGVKREARLVFEMAKRHDDPWIRGEFSVWLRRAGDPPETDDTMAASYALQMRGDWRAAAAAWKAIGCATLRDGMWRRRAPRRDEGGRLEKCATCVWGGGEPDVRQLEPRRGVAAAAR